ncbi:hypothetical protein K474DRAFT_974717 [Panus rudis PR-1116 ss-1]|nr:hypothetical protein K474DRAFT_974717 [Panus rudis PR-1116 ss-1]
MGFPPFNDSRQQSLCPSFRCQNTPLTREFTKAPHMPQNINSGSLSYPTTVGLPQTRPVTWTRIVWAQRLLAASSDKKTRLPQARSITWIRIVSTYG